MPKLSVITISRDDPRGLTLTLGSLKPLLSHLRWPWEQVVVDASPAVNGPVIGALAPKWPLVRAERPPLGIYDAFNQALGLVTGHYVWFLNGGDRLRHFATLEHMLSILDRNDAVDLVCAGVCIARNESALYPRLPRRTYLGNILGGCRMYHQAVIYRSEALARVGPYSTVYGIAGDYEYHVRCYLAGLSALFLDEVLVDFDSSGRSSNIGGAFAEVEAIHRAYRPQFPRWVNWANEVIRREEYRRIWAFRRVGASRIGGRLRPAWYRLNRWACQPACEAPHLEELKMPRRKPDRAQDHRGAKVTPQQEVQMVRADE